MQNHQIIKIEDHKHQSVQEYQPLMGKASFHIEIQKTTSNQPKGKSQFDFCTQFTCYFRVGFSFGFEIFFGFERNFLAVGLW